MDNLLDCLTTIQTELSRLHRIVHEAAATNCPLAREGLRSKLKQFETNLHNIEQSITFYDHLERERQGHAPLGTITTGA